MRWRHCAMQWHQGQILLVLLQYEETAWLWLRELIRPVAGSKLPKVYRSTRRVIPIIETGGPWM